MTVIVGEELTDFSEPLLALLTTHNQHNVAPAIAGGRRLRDSERDPLMRTIIPGISYPLDDINGRREIRESLRRRSLDLDSNGEAPPPYAAASASTLVHLSRLRTDHTLTWS